MKQKLFSILLLALIAINSVLFCQDRYASVHLELGKSVYKELRADEIHKYQVNLKSNKFHYGCVLQQGIDVVLRIFNPEGKKIEEIDSPNGTFGTEQFFFVSKNSGDYTIEVQSVDHLAYNGKYSFKMEYAAETKEGKVNQLFEQWDNISSPGAAVAVVKDRQIIYKNAFGAANLEYDIPNTSSTLFNIGSVSKQFTAFAVALLAQQKKLSLDDDIRKYIPEVPDFGKKITIKQLIHHTSGLRDYIRLLAMAGWRTDDIITQEHILKIMKHQKELNFNPGDEYLYSNIGYVLLAEIVARATGKSFSEWTKDNIFEPLGMTKTLFFDDHEKIVRNMAYSYSITENNSYKKSVLNAAIAGPGCLVTSTEDLCKWVTNFDNNIVGNPQLFRQMEERGILSNGDTTSYAFGQRIVPHKGLHRIFHGGSDAGYRAALVRFPKQKLAVIFLSNFVFFDPDGMALKIADIYLADSISEEEPKKESEHRHNHVIHKVKPLTLSLKQLAEFEGDFYSAELRTTYSIILKGTKLVAEHQRHEDAVLIPRDKDKFRGPWSLYNIKFVRDKNNKIIRFMVTSPRGRVRNLRFDRIN